MAPRSHWECGGQEVVSCQKSIPVGRPAYKNYFSTYRLIVVRFWDSLGSNATVRVQAGGGGGGFSAQHLCGTQRARRVSVKPTPAPHPTLRRGGTKTAQVESSTILTAQLMDTQTRDSHSTSTLQDKLKPPEHRHGVSPSPLSAISPSRFVYGFCGYPRINPRWVVGRQSREETCTVSNPVALRPLMYGAVSPRRWYRVILLLLTVGRQIGTPWFAMKTEIFDKRPASEPA